MSEKVTAAGKFKELLQEMDTNGVCVRTDDEIFDQAKAACGCPEYHRYWYPDYYREYWTKKGEKIGTRKPEADYDAKKAAHKAQFKGQLAEKRKEHRAAKKVSLSEKDLVTVLNVMKGETSEVTAKAILKLIAGDKPAETQTAEVKGVPPIEDARKAKF